MLDSARLGKRTAELPIVFLERGKVSYPHVLEEKMSIFDALFGCMHKRTTFPQSKRGVGRPPAADRTGTYVACLDCGKEFAYDWQNMRIMSPREQKSFAQSQVEAEAS